MDLSNTTHTHTTDQSFNTTSKEDVKTYVDLRKTQIIEMVVRQTDYSFEEAKEKLEENHYQYMKVIEEYMEVDKIKEERDRERREKEEGKSVNQKIYSQIRTFMDDSARKFEQKKKYMEERGYKPAVRDTRDTSNVKL